MFYILISIAVGLVGLLFASNLLSQIKVGEKKSKVFVKQLVERPFGLLERYYAAFDPPRLFCIALNINNGPVPTVQQVKDVMIALSIRHPILSAGLNYAPCADPPSFHQINLKPQDALLPVRRVRRQTEATFQSVIEAELNTPFDNFSSPSTLLWRVILVANEGHQQSAFDLLFVFHHIAADGMSGINLAKEFIELYQELHTSGTLTSTIKVPDSVPMPLEYLVDIRPSLTFMCNTLLELLTPSFLKKQRKDYLGPPHSPQLHPLKTTLGFICVEKELARALAAVSKEYKTTVHGALCAASFFACARAYLRLRNERTYPSAGVYFRGTSPVSLLSDLASQGQGPILGPYVYGSAFEKCFTTKTQFWQVASEVRKSIMDNKATDLQMNGMLSFLGGSWREFVNRKRVQDVPNARLTSIEVSNLGRIDFPAPIWDIEKTWFSQGNHYSGPVFCNSVATTKGNLSCSVSVPSPLISEIDKAQFVSDFQECLLACTTAGAGFTLGTFLDTNKNK